MFILKNLEKHRPKRRQTTLRFKCRGSLGSRNHRKKRHDSYYGWR